MSGAAKVDSRAGTYTAARREGDLVRVVLGVQAYMLRPDEAKRLFAQLGVAVASSDERVSFMGDALRVVARGAELFGPRKK